MLIKNARRLIILVVGITVLLIGFAMIVLPGPAVVVIPAGLAILGTEFLWAKRMLNKMKRKAKTITGKVNSRTPHCPSCECELTSGSLQNCPDCGTALHAFEVQPR